METISGVVKKKINKRTTYSQFEKLVELMEEFPHLATGAPVFGSNRADLETTWNIVTQTLNAMGPPERTLIEWKKTWADLKSRTKQNIVDNNKSIIGTGGGPCHIKPLTALEMQIDKICHLSSAADPKGKVFGRSVQTLKTPPRKSNNIAVITPTRTHLQEIDEETNSPQSTSKTTTTKSAPLQSTCLSENLSPDVIVTSAPQNSQHVTTSQRKRKYKQHYIEDNEQNKLLRQQVTSQNAILVAMQMQAESVKCIADDVKAQTQTFKQAAESTRTIAQALVDIVNHLKNDDM